MTIAGILGMTHLASSMLSPISNQWQGAEQIRSTKLIWMESQQVTEIAIDGPSEWSMLDLPFPRFIKISFYKSQMIRRRLWLSFPKFILGKKCFCQHSES